MNEKRTTQPVLKVLVVEDSMDLQVLLRAMLNEIPSVEVVASVDNQAAAVQALKACCADLAIVDLELATGTGLGFLKELSEQLDTDQHVKVVIFSNYSNLIIRHRCLNLGAKAFFDKSFQIDELLEFVQAEASGKAKSLTL
ncbi:response regulator [Limnobacter parvus]|uniref:Response regulator n=1 Tax=Limnobacter parvus TaxID=2939690 RepID=A0ABT1XIW4_9BURK|nr:response regulator [Limnobacter parvus]MCR2746844.1 response regulator [Limnobacter parvus]